MPSSSPTAFGNDQGMNAFRLPSNKKDVSGSSDVKEKKKRTKGLKKRNKGGTPLCDLNFPPVVKVKHKKNKKELILRRPPPSPASLVRPTSNILHKHDRNDDTISL
jgi:hypothetical protein